MKRNIKIFVADYDGTLIPDRPNHYITPFCLSVLKELRQNGVLVGLASGKDITQRAEIDNLTSEYFDFMIGLNGAEYYEFQTDEHITLCGLTKEARKTIVTTMLEKYPDINPGSYVPGVNARLVYKLPTEIIGHVNTRRKNIVAKDLSEFWNEDGGKIMFRNPVDVTEKIWNEFAKDFYGPDFAPTRTETSMIEFNHKDATKGKALKIYCEKHGIDLNDVAAFGDMTNDNSMLEVVGLSVAVGNADPETKKLCKIVLDKTCNEDAVAHFVKDEILGN